MSTPIFDWPIAVLTPAHPAFWPEGGLRHGPDSASQLQLLDTLDGGPVWMARYAQIPVYCRDRVLAAQAVQGLAATLGLFRVWRRPAERGAVLGGVVGGQVIPGVPWSDQSSFSDGSLWSGVSTVASITASADLYASIVQVTVIEGTEIEAGMEFSVYDATAGWRMHRITRVLGVVGAISELEIMPPLRFDVAADQVADFMNPSCTMRMTNWQTFLQMLEWNRWADLTAEFEEARW